MILVKPSGVRCSLNLIISAAKVKSLKSFSLIVFKGYKLKKGIILSILSEKVGITKSQAKPFYLFYTLSQSKYLVISPNK